MVYDPKNGCVRGSVIDQTIPEGKWEFDSKVTDVFEDMLLRSIPDYNTMRELVFEVGKDFVAHKTAIVDLGCSKGDALAPFVDKFGSYNTYYGVDTSEPMIQAANKKFEGYVNVNLVTIKNMDLKQDYPPMTASLTLAILTLQFIPIEYRQQILRKIFNHTLPGGAFILVEKVLGNSAQIDSALVNQYYKIKKDHGYSVDQINRKRMSLEGVLVPITAKMNEEWLRDAGFRYVDCFWRMLNFSGWLAIREGVK